MDNPESAPALYPCPIWHTTGGRWYIAGRDLSDENEIGAERYEYMSAGAP